MFIIQFVNTDNYQHTKFSFFTAKATVNAIDPDVDPLVFFKAPVRILSLTLALGAKSCLQTTLCFCFTAEYAFQVQSQPCGLQRFRLAHVWQN